MKDVIEEQRQAVLLKLDGLRLLSEMEFQATAAVVGEAFQKIQAEADFIINRLQGEAGLIERAATKLPKTAHLLKAQATIMRGYAARMGNS